MNDARGWIGFYHSLRFVRLTASRYHGVVHTVQMDFKRQPELARVRWDRCVRLYLCMCVYRCVRLYLCMRVFRCVRLYPCMCVYRCVGLYRSVYNICCMFVACTQSVATYVHGYVFPSMCKSVAQKRT